ncbi:transcriptional regulator (plasmid) [Pedobacter sp. BS3]|uniref:transcriptional regulator n=1 Tax=Pedobacter sp. BS3 TaxID=2567937 RepID=UPI0011EC4A67|nr:transcriptional regulator [Pedobacter sp. BS3]TZF85722.1 transcriptional regulator [Pedobacter sp. BS3]
MKSKEIQVTDIWNEGKRKSLSDFILSHSQKQTREQKIRNELLAIKYQIEDYITSENTAVKLEILDFVKLYLKTFNITQRKLADLFEMQNSNLHKYLTGERKLNSALVLKLSSFSHIGPEYWLRIEVKNELIEINKEKAKNKDYRKYDYRNLLVAAE